LSSPLAISSHRKVFTRTTYSDTNWNDQCKWPRWGWMKDRIGDQRSWEWIGANKNYLLERTRSISRLSPQNAPRI
jgi:hypothetical protein